MESLDDSLGQWWIRLIETSSQGSFLFQFVVLEHRWWSGLLGEDLLSLDLVQRFHCPLGDLLVSELWMDQPSHEIFAHLQKLLLNVLLSNVVWHWIHQNLVLLQHLLQGFSPSGEKHTALLILDVFEHLELLIASLLEQITFQSYFAILLYTARIFAIKSTIVTSLDAESSLKTDLTCLTEDILYRW